VNGRLTDGGEAVSLFILSWLQIQMSRFDSRRYQISLERSPLSLESITLSTSGGRSVGTVRPRTQATELILV
jgi:hypothetical protein